MKRDIDLIRDILLKIEDGQQVFEPISSDMASCLNIPPETPMSKEEAHQGGHLDLLEQAGFIEIKARLVGGSYLIKGLTWQGHKFLDDIRDPDIWGKTKGARQRGCEHRPWFLVGNSKGRN